MRRICILCCVIVFALLFSGLMFTQRSYGTAADTVSSAQSPAQATGAVGIEWGVLGLVLSGGLILLARPKRRDVQPPSRK